jgi:light-regulated signal transduction histidine kinase (bacteriophytochrome)
MHKVFSHDLPNQMVVLQSLLQLLSEEETPRLSEEGREYVRRLQNATKHASELVRFLKDMGRLNVFMNKSETISLNALARELQGELQNRHVDKRFEFEWQWNAPTIVGDPRTFSRALLELFAAFLPPQSTECRVSARSTAVTHAIELAFRLEVKPEAVPPIANAKMLDQRMEIVLAREWLALGGGRLEVKLPADGEVCFSILVPNR